ncbi:hypothetical protein D3C86_1194160 [compost metagenome]
MHHDLRLPHPYCFYQQDIKSGGFTQDDRFTCFPGHTSQGISSGRRTNKYTLILGQSFHPGFIPEDTSARTFAARINGQHSYFFPAFQNRLTEFFNKRTFSHARNTRNPDPQRIPGKRQTHADQFTPSFLVCFLRTFQEGDCTAQCSSVSQTDSFKQRICRTGFAHLFARLKPFLQALFVHTILPRMEILKYLLCY